MQFDSFQAFLEMGGYGFYVWWSFGLTFLSVGLIWLSSVQKGRRILNAVRQEQLRKQRQEQAQKVETVL